RFAGSVALFGSMLRGSKHVKAARWDDVLSMTKESMDETNPLHKEFYELVNKTKKIYTPLKKKKKRGKEEDEE
ncbi:MAG: DUF3520 domain-containing protein, partial [Chitinophagaceae bacterium]|nr:DUF3520 domain-containing protein [Chitinophagaceae bacterium]